MKRGEARKAKKAKAIGKNQEFRIIIDSYLGGGGFSEVYLCVKEDEPELPLVVKITAKSEANNQIIANELGVAGRLPAHPNVVRVYCCEQSEHNVYLVMEHCDVSLARLLQKRVTFDEEQFLDLFFQLSQGLLCLAEAGIVHNDIKPENVMLSQSTYKLIDFGSACFVGTVVTCLYSSLVYSAPQYFKKGHQSSHLTDIYSLGVVFYYALVGQHPYIEKGQKLPEQPRAYLKHLEKPPLSFKERDYDLPLRPVVRMIERMVARNQEDRLKIEQLKEYVASSPVFQKCRRRNFGEKVRRSELLQTIIKLQSDTRQINLGSYFKQIISTIHPDKTEQGDGSIFKQQQNGDDKQNQQEVKEQTKGAAIEKMEVDLVEVQSQQGSQQQQQQQSQNEEQQTHVQKSEKALNAAIQAMEQQESQAMMKLSLYSKIEQELLQQQQYRVKPYEVALDEVLQNVNTYLDERLAFVDRLQLLFRRITALSQKQHDLFEQLALRQIALLLGHCIHRLLQAACTQQSPFPFQIYFGLAGFAQKVKRLDQCYKRCYQWEELLNAYLKSTVKRYRDLQPGDMLELKRVELCQARDSLVDCSNLLAGKLAQFIKGFNYYLVTAKVDSEVTRSSVLEAKSLLDLEKSLSQFVWSESLRGGLSVGGFEGEVGTKQLRGELLGELGRRGLPYILSFLE